MSLLLRYSYFIKNNDELLEIFFTLFKLIVLKVLTNMLNTFKITNACTIASHRKLINVAKIKADREIPKKKKKKS